MSGSEGGTFGTVAFPLALGIFLFFFELLMWSGWDTLPLDLWGLGLLVLSMLPPLSSGCAVGHFVLVLLSLSALSLFSKVCAFSLSFSCWFFNICTCLCFVNSFLFVSTGAHTFLSLLHMLLLLLES